MTEKKGVDCDLKVGQLLGEQREVIEKNREDEDLTSSLPRNQQHFMKSTKDGKTKHGQQDEDIREQEPIEQMEIGETNTNKRKLQFEETLCGSPVRKRLQKGNQTRVQ